MFYSSNATSDKSSYNTDIEAYTLPEKDFSIGVKPPHLYRVLKVSLMFFSLLVVQGEKEKKVMRQHVRLE